MYSLLILYYFSILFDVLHEKFGLTSGMTVGQKTFSVWARLIKKGKDLIPDNMIRIKSITSTKRLDWDPKRVNNYNSLTAESQRTLRLTYFFALR